MIVEKVLNNNVVVSIEPKTRKEIILMGQGIAFGKKIGQEIDESKIEKRFMVEDEVRKVGLELGLPEFLSILLS